MPTQKKASITSELHAYPWRSWAAILLVLLSFIILPIIANILISLVPQLLGWSEERAELWIQTSAANFLYVLLAEVLMVGALVWFIRSRKGSLRRTFALGRPGWLDAGYALAGTATYFVLFIITLVVVSHVVSINTQQEQAIGFARDIVGLDLLMAFVSLVVLPPIVEEIIFRGFLYGTLRSRKVSAAIATVVTSIIFAALHLFGSVDGGLLWIAFVDTLVLAFVLCYVREQTGRIWASIGVHAFKNAFVFLNLFILRSV